MYSCQLQISDNLNIFLLGVSDAEEMAAGTDGNNPINTPSLSDATKESGPDAGASETDSDGNDETSEINDANTEDENTKEQKNEEKNGEKNEEKENKKEQKDLSDNTAADGQDGELGGDDTGLLANDNANDQKNDDDSDVTVADGQDAKAEPVRPGIPALASARRQASAPCR